MSRKSILFVGEDPNATTGNGHMMHAILEDLQERDRFDFAVFGASEAPPWETDLFKHLAFRFISASDGGDPWGRNKLLNVISASPRLDALVMVGIDLFRYAPIARQLAALRKEKGFRWVWIFPYDLQEPRHDWVEWIKMIDFPCVYSRYGEKLLKGAVPNIRYFRPPMAYAEMYEPYSPEERLKVRKKKFPTVRDDQFIFGFVGPNQFRKDPQRLIKAFKLVKEQVPDSVLYLHTRLQNQQNGAFNLVQCLDDMGLKTGEVLACDGHFTEQGMVEIYNAIDCLVNCSMQEGLSWTVLNAMLCGTPVIASDTTAQTELVKGAGLLVPCEEPAFIPLCGKHGDSWIEAKCCKPEHIAAAMIVATKPETRQSLRELGLARAREWLQGVSDIDELLDEATAPRHVVRRKIQAVLFAQHSSAGDVLMTTRCFKGIKERHPKLPLVFMTMKQFQDIVTGNPYIDEIVDWDPEMLRGYEIVYNPHGQRILPGGFNSLDVKLSDMYPYFCRVEPDEFFIQEICPFLGKVPGFDKLCNFVQVPYTHIGSVNPFIIVHTSGGSKEYRTYKHMDIALKGIGLPVIQIGGRDDLACQEATLDLRGKLTWRETAWLMKRAKAAVVIDSFPAHLAGALGTPVVVLFGPAPARVTGPVGKGKIVCLEPDKLSVCPSLTNCHGQMKCQSPCINSINPMTIRKALKGLLDE